MKRPLRLLLIEDSVADAELLLAEIESSGFEVTHRRVESAQGTADALAAEPWDMVISDYNLPQFNGMAAIEIVRQHDPDLPFLITSGAIGEDIAVEAMRAGARDYVMKHNLSRLSPAIDRELREYTLRRSARRARIQLEENEARFRAIVSNIPGMVFQLISDAGGRMRFTYVSEGSMGLLGLTPYQLQADCTPFFDRLLEHHESGLRSQIQAAAKAVHSFTWEGRIRALSGDSTHWLEVRMSPHALDNDCIQWDGILEDISQRKRVEVELLRSQRDLSALSSHLQKAKETERTSIAREVHDDIGGNLTALKIDLLWLIKRMGHNDPEVLEKAHSLVELTNNTLAITSRIAHDLRPPLLDQGLLAAVEWEATEFAKRMGIPCKVHCNDEELAVEPELASTLFSVFREALTNIAKHAGASHVEVELNTDGKNCTLSVTDDGCGITQTKLLRDKSFGLRGMLERTRNLGGGLSFDGTSGQGTKITAHVPLDPATRQPANFDKSTGTLWSEY